MFGTLDVEFFSRVEDIGLVLFHGLPFAGLALVGLGDWLRAIALRPTIGPTGNQGFLSVVNKPFFSQ